MTGKEPFSARFMKATGKLRMFFGPAQGGSTEGPVVYVDDEAHRRRQAELQQWTVVRNADGSTYLKPRKEP
ncbi:hypothetical protein FJV46_08560 [Arthrobacter agilis]|uniref:hypothetical protein n=1 Tax=Arthrobacter agilis TaxID=37921 RepID=UPI000B3511A2|nr:hypothetical protein [Arthrobacter agilis]OUM43175.1 hypothetical protein B8W74_08085 [Arthrobacter agilis]PPB46119.1 hypothetical protein CI784_10285 [Arthrobacter agilis]TPV25660.1 hypothetical protein FJV46_08560 [Arthrobacter agilis]VDR33440.1 Uncharacterised protein [Arthrobacter agilis]